MLMKCPKCGKYAIGYTSKENQCICENPFDGEKELTQEEIDKLKELEKECLSKIRR